MHSLVGPATSLIVMVIDERKVLSTWRVIQVEVMGCCSYPSGSRLRRLIAALIRSSIGKGVVMGVGKYQSLVKTRGKESEA